MRSRAMLLLILCALLFPRAAFDAVAEEAFAPEITGLAEIRVSRNKADIGLMLDNDYKTEWRDDAHAVAEFALPGDQPCHALYVQMSGDPNTLIVETETAGAWHEADIPGERFNNQCVVLEGGAVHIRLRSTKEALRLIEVRLFGAGKLPPDIVQYHATADKADLMVVACHPDDDILWLGGLMPTYAGELGMKVQMVYMTSRFSYRRCEAMDAIWHCGVKQGPVFLGLPDSTDKPYREAAAMWGGHQETTRRIARLIRRYRPEVVVTQDVNGEYGHAQHRIMSAACTRAIRMAADPKARSLRDLPPWEVKKYYIHLYPENGVVLDFERPLSAFGGKTAYQMAQEAFLLHRSQQSGRYSVAIDGPYDIRRFGLAYSSVGPDEAHDRLFEHVPGLEDVEKRLGI